MAQGDRNNFSGDVTLTAPTGGVVRGQIYLIGDAYWVARETADAGDSFLAASPAHGAVEVAKAAGTGKALAVGDKVFVKTAKIDVAVSTGSSLVLGGVGCLKAAAAADTSVIIGPIAMTNNVT
jgi:predicted RecA/RadA family phage recombinase